MSDLSKVSTGFTDPVHDAQAAFRAVLDALSRPGRQFAIGQPVPGLALGPAMACVLLALTDGDTAVWWQQADLAAATWLRFHTGARQATTPADAAFAVLASATDMPPLAAFAAGSAEAPERSATLLLEVASLDDGPPVEWRGPGIQGTQTVHLAGLPNDFWVQWQASQAAFPQGVDIVFTCAGRALGLPRTTCARHPEEI